jgi:uncharacterized protein
MATTTFNGKQVLHELKHYLPSQTALKDFIHHNSLHTFQQMKFYDAIFKPSKIFGFQATMELPILERVYKPIRSAARPLAARQTL